jgi:ribosome maturation factor RimP
MQMAGNSTAQKVSQLVLKPIEDLGLKLWDVRFVKEGASWYLRIFIDKEGGVGINDCTDVSHAVDPILDEADPIDVSYYLEVCSPGLGRELRSKEHFESFIGSEISLTLYKAREGVKTFRGILKQYNEGPVLEIDGENVSFTQSEVSKAKLCDDE